MPPDKKRQRGVVRGIATEKMGDGAEYSIDLDKEKGYFSCEVGEDWLTDEKLEGLRRRIVKVHNELAEADYRLVIAINTEPSYGGLRGVFSLDSFSFAVFYIWERPGKHSYKREARFWDGVTMEPSFGRDERRPDWSTKPYGPNDQVRIAEGGGQSAFGDGKQIPYTWERWALLTDLKKRIGQLRRELGQFFDTKELAEGMDRLITVGAVPQLLPAAEKEPKE
jgi:hypothetical protein